MRHGGDRREKQQKDKRKAARNPVHPNSCTQDSRLYRHTDDDKAEERTESTVRPTDQPMDLVFPHLPASVGIWKHPSASAGIVGIWKHPSVSASNRQDLPASVRIWQHPSSHISICDHLSSFVMCPVFFFVEEDDTLAPQS